MAMTSAAAAFAELDSRYRDRRGTLGPIGTVQVRTSRLGAMESRVR